MTSAHDETERRAPAEVTGMAVIALILSVMGLAFWCPCVGSILGVVLGRGQESDVGRAAVVLGWIGLGLSLLVALTFGGALVVLWAVEHA